VTIHFKICFTQITRCPELVGMTSSCEFAYEQTCLLSCSTFIVKSVTVLYQATLVNMVPAQRPPADHRRSAASSVPLLSLRKNTENSLRFLYDSLPSVLRSVQLNVYTGKTVTPATANIVSLARRITHRSITQLSSSYSVRRRLSYATLIMIGWETKRL
jgi:hypothetical protein